MPAGAADALCGVCTGWVSPAEVRCLVVQIKLADVAAEMVGRRAGSARDPMMRSERVEIPGVRTVDRSYWVDAADAVDITPDMASALANYRTWTVG